MGVLYVTVPGAVVRKRAGRLEVFRKGKVLAAVPAHTTEQIVVMGPGHLTTAACMFCLTNGVDVYFLTSTGRYAGKLQPAFSKQLPARKAQYSRAADADFCLELSKNFVLGKLRNARSLLQRRRRQDAHSNETVDRAIADLEEAPRRVAEAKSLDELRGVEGTATRVYFGGLRCFISEEWGFARRTRRPPADPANALLSLAYSLLHTQCLSALAMTGLDPYQGFYHTNKYGRTALALDLMEEFRPLISDRVVLAAIGTRIVQREDFRDMRPGIAPMLAHEAVRSYCAFFESRMRAKVRHSTIGSPISYRRCLQVQARLLAKCVLGEIPTYSPFVPGK